MSKKGKTIRAKLIANPGSGNVYDKGKFLEQTTLFLREMGIDVDVALAKPHEKAKAIARRAVENGYKTIITMGGDDTIEAVIRGMYGSKARLGMIPTGTANNLAKSLGIPEDIEQACALIASGQFRKLDMGEVKTRNGKKFPFFEVVTIGISSAIYTDALQASKGKKPLNNLRDALRTVMTHETSPRVTLLMNEDSYVAVDTMLVIVSNVPLIGPNMLVDPEASLDDGLVEVSVFPNFSKPELAAYAMKVINEGHQDDKRIQRYRAYKLKIKTSPKLKVLVDGVLLGKGTVRIKVNPGALRVFAPPVGAGIEKKLPEFLADLPAPVVPKEIYVKATKNGNVHMPQAEDISSGKAEKESEKG